MTEKNQTKIKRVAILIESSRGYGRGLIHGIGKYIDANRNWQVEYRPRGLSEPVPHWLKEWQGDGILARINNRHALRSFKRLGVPIIDLRRMLGSPGIPQVGPDDQVAVQLLFDHFRQRGFQRFAFVGLPRGEHVFMDLRRDYCAELVQSQEFPFSELEISMEEFETGHRGERRLKRFLAGLPTLTAVLACNDDLGLQILNACRTAKINVPKTLAVAGIGNDGCLCELASPKMTSVDLNPVRIGMEAAAMLQQMMDGQRDLPDSVMIRPNRIIPRASTNTIASEDELVAEMVQYIRSEACNGIAVKDVLTRSRISRTALEQRFKSSIGHTIFQEILAVRLEHVQELLSSTDLTIKEITRQTGFNYQAYLMHIFQKQFGMTMRAFRKAYWRY